MKVIVDREKCSGHARCNAIGPDIYELDDDGYIALSQCEVPAHLEQQAIDGADSCPEGAIRVE